MPELTNIPSDMVAPGDLVDVKYEIVSDNATLVGLAVSEIKKSLWSDPRFDYQGSRQITVGDQELQRDVQILTVTVSVRQTLRDVRPDTQEAVIGYIAIGALIGLVMGAIAAYSGAVVYKSYTIRRIAGDASMADGTKQVALTAAGKPVLGISTMIASLGTGGLIVAGLILYAIFRHPRRIAPSWSE